MLEEWAFTQRYNTEAQSEGGNGLLEEAWSACSGGCMGQTGLRIAVTGSLRRPWLLWVWLWLHQFSLRIAWKLIVSFSRKKKKITTARDLGEDSQIPSYKTCSWLVGRRGTASAYELLKQGEDTFFPGVFGNWLRWVCALQAFGVLMALVSGRHSSGPSEVGGAVELGGGPCALTWKIQCVLLLVWDKTAKFTWEKKPKWTFNTNSEYGMLLLTFLCDMVSNSDTQTSSNYRRRKAVFAFLGTEIVERSHWRFTSLWYRLWRTPSGRATRGRGSKISWAAWKRRKTGPRVV